MNTIIFLIIDCIPHVDISRTLNSNVVFDFFFSITIVANYGYAEKNQTQRCCLIVYGINWTNDFPLDYIHLELRGVLLLNLFWKEGPRGPHKLSTVQWSQKFQTSWKKWVDCCFNPICMELMRWNDGEKQNYNNLLYT